MTIRKQQPRDERGAVTIYFAVVMVALLLGVGLIADSGSKIRAGRKVTLAASEAARAASQHLQPGVVIGQDAQVDPTKGAAAARSYLRTAGVNGTVTVTGDTVRITTSMAWSPEFYGGLFSGSTLTGSATATAQRP